MRGDMWPQTHTKEKRPGDDQEPCVYKPRDTPGGQPPPEARRREERLSLCGFQREPGSALPAGPLVSGARPSGRGENKSVLSQAPRSVVLYSRSPGKRIDRNIHCCNDDDRRERECSPPGASRAVNSSRSDSLEAAPGTAESLASSQRALRALCSGAPSAFCCWGCALTGPLRSGLRFPGGVRTGGGGESGPEKGHGAGAPARSLVEVFPQAPCHVRKGRLSSGTVPSPRPLVPSSPCLSAPWRPGDDGLPVSTPPSAARVPPPASSRAFLNQFRPNKTRGILGDPFIRRRGRGGGAAR